MQSLSRSYWAKRKLILLAAGSCGLAFIAYAMTMPAHNRGFILGIFLMFALLCSPFTLKTIAGRLWWATFVIAIGTGVGAVLLGVHNPLGWVCAVAAGCAYAVGVCLRWNPAVV